MRTFLEIKNTLSDTLKKKIKDDFRPGSIIDFFLSAVANSEEQIYQEIEDAKNPHLYSKLKESNLDDMCSMVGLERRNEETDSTLLYRFHNWTLENAKANTTAISDALLNLEYASNVTYIPQVHGCGTGVAYIIPKTYETDIIEKALLETKKRLENVISPSLYVEYIVPQILSIQLQCDISFQDDIDQEALKSIILLKIYEYINNIPPKDYVDLGTIEKIVLKMPEVRFFRVISYAINEKQQTSLRILQETDTKLMLNNIIWTVVN